MLSVRQNITRESAWHGPSGGSAGKLRMEAAGASVPGPQEATDRLRPLL
jgi:hypothetical protein